MQSWKKIHSDMLPFSKSFFFVGCDGTIYRTLHFQNLVKVAQKFRIPNDILVAPREKE